jgi:hypothetical protein
MTETAATVARTGRKLVIGVKVAALDPTLASAWYRGLYPAVRLRALGHRVEVFDRTPADLRSFDVLVLVKPTHLTDLACATEAHNQGVPLVIDLCDDVFVAGYGSKNGREALVCSTVAGICAAAVTTGPVLAARLRGMVPVGAPVVEIADPVENETDNAIVLSAFRAAFACARIKPAARRILGHPRLQAIREAVRPRRRLYRLAGLLCAAPQRLARARRVPLTDLPRRLSAAVRRRLTPLLGLIEASRPVPRIAPSPAPAAGAEPLGASATPAAMPRASALLAAPRPAMPPSVEPAPGERRKTVIWFGIKGAAHGDFGIRNLALIAPQLARVASTIPLRLLVVSNGRDEFERVTAGWPFPCDYRDWSRETILHDLDAADVCVIPNSRDAFSIGKSANRHALALSRGVPVVATDIPALHDMKDFIILEDWEAGLRTYLTDPARAAADVAAGRAFVDRSFSPGALALQWQALLREVVARSESGRRSDPPAGMTVLAFLDLVQDLDVLIPVLEAMKADPRFSPEVCITDRLATASPRVLRTIVDHGLTPRIVTRKDVIAGKAPALDRVAALLTAAETSHPAHCAAHALASRAMAAGVSTFTFQHGLENIGLTYFAQDLDHPGPIRFASAHILTWGAVEALPEEVLPETRARCFATGCSKPVEVSAAALQLPAGAHRKVAIFENLHWERYDTSFVNAFLRDITATAWRFPGTLFLVKPHHAARWLAKNAAALGDRPTNLLLADPADPAWEPFTAGALIGAVDAVITTPSTVALDASRCRCPVAVAGYSLDLPVYAPLPILRTTEDWAAFLEGLGAPGSDIAARMERFRDRHLVPGEAMPRILDAIAQGIAGRPEAAE